MSRLGPPLTLLACALLGACADRAVPVPRLPQVEQAQETLHGGGERYRAHRTCTATGRDVEGFVACMAAAGYVFVVRSPDWPGSECWQIRERADPTDLPAPQCFVHAADTDH